MLILNISDDDLTYKQSKWLLEYARVVGCDRFSFDIEIKENDVAIKYQHSLLEQLQPFSLGSENAEIIVTYNREPSIRRQNMWALTNESIQIILKHMGRNLLDNMLAENEGISGWRIYKKNEKKVHVSAVYGFDYFFFVEPPSGLINRLGDSAKFALITNKNNGVAEPKLNPEC
ncbi:hypothetical protein L4C36_15180 [Photobacterium japonica]|uniref:hypothetical protein n=1 Tax=Photobacterium japonica TaxID=2910235 RepID=UPI003D0961B8